MKISEHIAKMQDILAEHGDLEVTCYSNDGQLYSRPVIDHFVDEYTPERIAECEAPSAFGMWPPPKCPYKGKIVILDSE